MSPQTHDWLLKLLFLNDLILWNQSHTHELLTKLPENQTNMDALHQPNIFQWFQPQTLYGSMVLYCESTVF